MVLVVRFGAGYVYSVDLSRSRVRFAEISGVYPDGAGQIRGKEAGDPSRQRIDVRGFLRSVSRRHERESGGLQGTGFGDLRFFT